MVKGVTRRVVVVKQPEGKLFEEAIFIIREDLLSKGGVSRQDIITEARQVAENYLMGCTEKRRKKLPAVVFAVCGAAATGLMWLMSIFLF